MKKSKEKPKQEVKTKFPKLSIHTYQHAVLRECASPLNLEEIDQIVKCKGKWYDRIEGMKEIIRTVGFGIAAPQVGFSKRVFVYFPSKIDKERIEVVINPVIQTITDKNIVMGFEGCLSIPRIGSFVPRPFGAKIQFVTDAGNSITAMISGHEANVFLHEFDHLNGVWFIDRGFNRSERRRFRKSTGIKIYNIDSKDRYITPE